jgi:hypothetical protein
MALQQTQQTELLFKSYLNFPYNIPNGSFTTETNVSFNNYVFNDEIIPIDICKNPVFTTGVLPTYYGLTSDDYEVYDIFPATNPYLEKFTRLKLVRVDANRAPNSFYRLDNSGNSLLKDAFQFNYGGIVNGNLNLAFNYRFFAGANSIDLADQTSRPIFDIKSGYVTFFGTVPSVDIYITFVRYIGPKGVKTDANTINITPLEEEEKDNNDYFPTFVKDTSGNQIINIDSSLKYNPSTNSLTFGNLDLSGNSTRTIQTVTEQALELGTNSEPRVHITSDGDVGIGTSNPGAKLDVNGNVNVTGGDLTGNVIGDLTGNVIGDITGNINLNTTGVINTGVSNIDITATELSYLDGVTSNIQNQINSITETSFTANRAIVSDGSGDLIASSVTDSELGFLSGVSSTLVETTKDQNIGGNKTFTSRVEQQLNGYESVSGYYGLAKDGQPIVSKAVADNVVSLWEARAAPNANFWYSVCWSAELGIFVAVSLGTNTSRVMTSPNGINWTGRTASDNSWFSVCWSPQLSLFVAVATGGTNRIMTSPNGTTWTTTAAPINNNWRSVCWAAELNTFVAVASEGGTASNRVMISSDGITWVSAAAPNTNEWQSVCWSPQLSRFVAVASAGGTASNRVMISSDGITWTATAAPNTNEWQSVCWSPQLSRFVAVASAGGSASNRVMISSDGITWTATAAPNTNEWTSICWSPELSLFCGLSSNGGTASDRIMTSSDGITWVARAAPNTNFWTSICWSPELSLFCGVSAFGGTSSNRVMTTSLNNVLPTQGTLSNKPYVYLDPVSTPINGPRILTGKVLPSDITSAGNFSVSFVPTFSSSPVITMTCNTGNNNQGRLVQLRNVNSSGFSGKVYSSFSTGGTNNDIVDVHWIAIGR